MRASAFPGHTEYLAHLASNRDRQGCSPVMMLAGPGCATVPVTIHIPLAEVPAVLSTELIVDDGAHRRQRICASASASRGRGWPLPASIRMPAKTARSAARTIEIIAPAVAALRADGIDAFGPLPADTMFHEQARATYDAAICMYHDQALIPAKALAFDEAVNVTLGLPFVRTSPDHGTAFDIAGTGKARADSLIAALKLAARLAATERAAA